MTDNLNLLDNYKTFVGPEYNWNTIPRLVIKKLFEHGLSPDTSLLDIGCGSLRTGRFLIPFLNTGNYHGLEPESIMVEQGIQNELIPEIVDFKKPNFYFNEDFIVPEIKIDIAIAIQVFIHCGPEQLKQCLSMLTTRLHGLLLFTVNIANDDKLEKKSGKFYSYRGASHSGTYYKLETMQEIFTQYNFSIKHIDNFFWMAWLNNSSERDLTSR